MEKSVMKKPLRLPFKSEGKRTRERCKQCGFRIRGPNHAEGTHHKEGSKSKKDKGVQGTGNSTKYRTKGEN
jgi:hypothetical protein